MYTLSLVLTAKHAGDAIRRVANKLEQFPIFIDKAQPTSCPNEYVVTCYIPYKSVELFRTLHDWFGEAERPPFPLGTLCLWNCTSTEDKEDYMSPPKAERLFA